MILLAGIAIGLALGVGLGGRPSRLLQLSFRSGWAVALALGVQIVLFSRLGHSIPGGLARALHLATYGLLAVFVWRNRRIRALLPLGAGMALNGLVITANGGKMPLSAAAARSAGIDPGPHANVSLEAHRLGFLGDVFALPRGLPLATVVSPGDVLIVVATIALVALVSLGGRDRPALDLGRLREPLRRTQFRKVAAARSISYLGDWLTIAAVVGWVYRGTGSTAAVAVVMLVRLAPPILGGGLAGVLVDRLPRRGLLVGLELARAACVALTLAALVQGSRIGVLAAFGCSGVLTAVADAATAALVPTLLPSDQLPAGNALLALLRDLAMAAGAAGAGVALLAGSAAPALAVDVASFVVAAVLLRGLRAVPAGRHGGRALDGFRYLRGRRLVLLLVASFSTATIATGLVNATLPSLLAGRGLGAGGYGFGIGALAAGAVAGELLVGLTALKPTADRWIGCGLIAVAVLFAALALADYGATAILCLAAIGCVDGSTDIVYSTVLQRQADPRMLGAVFGFSTSIMTTTMVVAFAVAPVAGRLVGSADVVFLAAGILVLGGLLGLAAVRGARRPGLAVPAPAPTSS